LLCVSVSLGETEVEFQMIRQAPASAAATYAFGRQALSEVDRRLALVPARPSSAPEEGMRRGRFPKPTSAGGAGYVTGEVSRRVHR
jgi:hypothetical protein